MAPVPDPPPDASACGLAPAAPNWKRDPPPLAPIGLAALSGCCCPLPNENVAVGLAGVEPNRKLAVVVAVATVAGASPSFFCPLPKEKSPSPPAVSPGLLLPLVVVVVDAPKRPPEPNMDGCETSFAPPKAWVPAPTPPNEKAGVEDGLAA